MAQMIDVDVFDNDERIIVNKACEGTPIADFTREGFLTNLSFARSISTEQDVLNLLDGLIAKTERISDDEWDGLKAKIPFATYYDADSNVDEVPQDEAV
jgi:hypothetical protein